MISPFILDYEIAPALECGSAVNAQNCQWSGLSALGLLRQFIPGASP
jgi:hypothetical protein